MLTIPKELEEAAEPDGVGPHFVERYGSADSAREGFGSYFLVSLGIGENEVTIIHCPHDRNAAYQAMLETIMDVPRPAAVYSGADLSAIGVVWACQRLGLRIPQDVAVIGHGNTPESFISVPQLKSMGPVSMDFTKAADLMASRVKDPSLPGRHLTAPFRLCVREST